MSEQNPRTSPWLIAGRVIFTLALIGCIAFIFSNSMQIGVVSEGASGRVLRLVQRVLTRLGMPGLASHITMHFIRKLAHFCEYALEGFLLMLCLRVYTRHFVRHMSWPILGGLLTALTDETIQLFSPGRSSQVLDVWLDFMGVLAGLLVGLFLVAASPVSNSLFVMFTSEPYRRWYYMLVFLLVLATIKVLDHLQDYPWRAGCGISAAVIAAITLYLYVKRDTIVYRKYWLVVLTLIAIGGVVLLFAALGGVRRLRLRRPMAALTACTALVAALTTGFTVGTYQRAYTQTIGLTTTEIYGDVIHSGDGLPDALPYRYYFWEPYSNRGMAAYLPDRTSFLSTLSPSIFTLYDALGDERHAITPAGPEGTNELLSVGYYIRNNSDWPDEIYTSFSNGHEQINVYQDSHALPIGFCYDTYMTRGEFDEIDPAERAHSMLKTLVVADEDEATVSTILRHYDAALDGKISQENKYADMDKRREACTDVFDYGTDYFYSEITSGSEQYAFFSVPYDKAWSATVNGESAEILNINGLMAVKVNAGKNCIRFHYSPTPLWCGIGVSAISILLTAIYLLAGRRSRKSKKEVL